LTAILIVMTAWAGSQLASSSVPGQAQVEALVKRLEDPDPAARQRAEEALIALGPAILERLPGVTDETSEELRARLVRVRRTLERLAADQIGRASPVTLKGDMTLTAAIDQLYTQTRNRVMDFREQLGEASSNPTVRLNYHDAPFWAVLDDVLTQCRLALYPYSGETRALAFVTRPPGDQTANEHVCYSGAFRIEATRLEAMRDLRDEQKRALRMALEVVWEPKSVPLTFSYHPSDLEARDEDQSMLIIADTRPTVDVPVQPTVSMVELILPFVPPDRSVRQIGTLRGKLSAALAGLESTFEFADLEEAGTVQQKQAGVTVVLQQARSVDKLIDIQVLVRFTEADEALQTDFSWMYNSPAYLVDREGKRFEHVGMETFSPQAGEVEASYKFDVGGELADYSFLYRTPAVVVTVPVTFELRNIALP
jgi:hypothetical protein